MSSASPLDHASVQRVRQALTDAGSEARVIVLSGTARSAQDAADSIGTALGSIVKSLVFTIADRPVMALVAGDRRCAAAALPGALGLAGKVRRADADAVRAATGFAIGGVAPLGHALPVVLDAGLARFPIVYAAAGHPHCVFATDLDELVRLTGGRLAPDIAPPA